MSTDLAELLAQVRTLPPLPPRNDQAAQDMVARLTSVQPCTRISAHTSTDSGLHVSLWFRMPSGAERCGGWACPILRSWETSVAYASQRRSHRLSDGSEWLEHDPFGDAVADFALALAAQMTAPHVAFLVDDYLGGW